MAQIPQFVQPNTGGAIRSIGQTVGNLITSIPELKQKGDEIEAAAQAAKDNWNDMIAAYKGVKATIGDRLTQHVNNGVITEQEKQEHLKTFTMPNSINRKDPKAYITELRDAVAKIETGVSTKASQQRVGGAVQKELLGTPAQQQPPIPQQVGPEQQITAPSGAQFSEAPITAREQPQPDIPAVPPAQSQLEAARGITQGELSPTEQQQAFQDPRIKALSTDVQLQKQTEKDSLEDAKRKKIEAETAYKIAVTNKIPGEVERSKKKLQLSQDALMNTYNRNIGSENTNILKTDSKIKKLKDKITFEENQDPDLGPGPDANIIAGYYSEIKDLNSEKENMLDKIQQLKKEKLMVGAMPGETRTAKGGGGSTKPVQSPGATQTITTPKQQQAIEWLKNNPNDPRAPGIRAKLQSEGVL